MGSREGTTTPLTFAYKHILEKSITFDLYLPQSSNLSQSSNHFPTTDTSGEGVLPVVLYFHGGGLTVGSKNSWFPHWLKDRVIAAGFAYITADYRLLPPATGHDLVEDIKDLFSYIDTSLNSALQTHPLNPHSLTINAKSILVTGTSAGGTCCYLASMHATPKPVGIVSMYGMGGDFLTPHYFSPKTKPFFRGRELLDPQKFASFLYPDSQSLESTWSSELSYAPATAPIPGYPTNPRMLLIRIYLQLGVFLDYYTDSFEPSLSAALREANLDTPQLDTLIPKEHLPLFPQFADHSSWPPTLLIHGEIDSSVPANDSIVLHSLLKKAGVESHLKIVPGEEHSFDYAPDAQAKHGNPGGLFDEIGEFIVKHLRR